MSKKIIAISAAIALAALAIVGGTLAWFTASDTATNVLTTGNITMTLTETDATGASAEGLTINGIMPGDTIHKDPTITNTSASGEAAYVRAKFAVTGDAGNAQGASAATVAASIDAKISTTDWLKGTDGWYYYKGTLAKNAAVKLFNEITFAGVTYGNDYQNAKFTVVITAQATQVKNQVVAAYDFTSMSALGWPA